MRRKWHLLALTPMLSLAVGLLTPVTAHAQDEAISLSPTQGPAGAKVTVVGTGWEDHSSRGLDVPITLDGDQLADPVPLKGRFKVTVMIPKGTPAGIVHIKAILGNGGSVSAPFKVTEPKPQQHKPRPPEKPSVVGGSAHKVVAGDTLWGIATKFLGSGALWQSVFNANKPAIEQAARKNGHATSNHGNLIVPATGLDLSSVRQEEPEAAHSLNVAAVCSNIMGKLIGPLPDGTFECQLPRKDLDATERVFSEGLDRCIESSNERECRKNAVEVASHRALSLLTLALGEPAEAKPTDVASCAIGDVPRLLQGSHSAALAASLEVAEAIYNCALSPLRMVVKLLNPQR
ncbi:LysM peptidoglycan-binding domain-containing protein [Streptomyces sp. NPDC059679]|uniref:LysM peptidoglycan-binding domain-containing protein n=1 Tax=Streptomyces sp. NPDC059679 TaxID=3346903 RepID=UPI003688CD92